MVLAIVLSSVTPALATPSESRMRSEFVPVCRTGSGALFLLSATDHDGTYAGQTTRFWWARLELGEAAWSFAPVVSVHTLDLELAGPLMGAAAGAARPATTSAMAIK